MKILGEFLLEQPTLIVIDLYPEEVLKELSLGLIWLGILPAVYLKNIETILIKFVNDRTLKVP